MLNSENIWKDRYYDLERTLEHILLGVANSMDKLERDAAENSKKHSPQGSPSFQIRRFLRSQDPENNIDLVYCVADGVNMEYRFTLFDGERVILETPFSRPNSLDLTRFSNAKFSACRVDVRTYTPEGPKETSKMLAL